MFLKGELPKLADIKSLYEQMYGSSRAVIQESSEDKEKKQEFFQHEMA